MSEPKLNIKEESSAKKTRSPPKKAKMEQLVPKKKKLKTDADLVFFKGTYDTPGMSHTGIYLGNGMMVSAGDPIKYANIHSSYWEKHLAGFGRLSK